MLSAAAVAAVCVCRQLQCDKMKLHLAFMALVALLGAANAQEMVRHASHTQAGAMQRYCSVNMLDAVPW
jgi:hypothetical protein